jgi:FlaA1/EpsC-like NDP-sugar epimerase
VLYELSEFNLYSIEQDLGSASPQLPLVRLIGDVKDLAHLQPPCRLAAAGRLPCRGLQACAADGRPQRLAALRNNTLGTWHAALAAAEAGAERFVLISTDKAVNPTNVMGATKRAAEMVVSAWRPSTRAPASWRCASATCWAAAAA